MKVPILIISFFIISLDVFAQPSIDSTVITFTAKPVLSDSGPCTPSTTSQKFVVIETNPRRSITSFYISNNDLSMPLAMSTTYVIKGLISFKDDWIYGCWGSRKQERRIYITPIKSELFIKRKVSIAVNNNQ